MKIGKALGSILVITVLVGWWRGGMDFASFSITFVVVSMAYLVVGNFIPGIPWVVFLDPMEYAAIVRLGKPHSIEGPGGPVFLIPGWTWVEEVVSGRHKATQIGPIQVTTSDSIEVVTQAVLVTRLQQDSEGKVLPKSVKDWAFGTTEGSRQAMLENLPAGIVRAETGRRSLKSNLGSQAKLPITNELVDLLRTSGREPLALIRSKLDIPDEYREMMSQGVAHRLEATGIDALTRSMEKAQKKGVGGLVVAIRRLLALERVDNPLVVMGTGDREGEIASIVAAIKAAEGKKDA